MTGKVLIRAKDEARVVKRTSRPVDYRVQDLRSSGRPPARTYLAGGEHPGRLADPALVTWGISPPRFARVASWGIGKGFR
ncbi:MAG: hypothetical protein ACRDS9_01810 [Pseudonocardiaceae bacterium]